MRSLVSDRARQSFLVAAVSLLMAGAVAAEPGVGRAAGEATCTSAEKSQYHASAVAYAKRMPKDRARYFKTHKSAKLRAAFVKSQKAKLKALRLKAACDDSTPPEPAPSIDLNPSPSASESFNFGPGMPAGAIELIKGDIAFAAEDENRLVGLALEKVTVFASTDATWLATQQCGLYGYGGDCVSGTASFYSSGQSAAQGGPGAVFIYWAAPSWQGGDAASKQKIIAHELFHVLQYQTDRLIHAGETPFDRVRPTGPVWLDEGGPEMIGFRVMADRLLGSYAGALGNQITVTKQIGTPLDQLERLSQTNVPSVYSLFALSVDHLVKATSTGLLALATYYRALGVGATWPEAFKQAFGVSVADYYANFADYRSKL